MLSRQILELSIPKLFLPLKPDHQVWLEAAKNLRLEQQSEMNIAERTKEQKNQTEQCETKIDRLRDSLKDVKVIICFEF